MDKLTSVWGKRYEITVKEHNLMCLREEVAPWYCIVWPTIESWKGFINKGQPWGVN
jgi:hypothetical protein